jgi:hypothetical protein
MGFSVVSLLFWFMMCLVTVPQLKLAIENLRHRQGPWKGHVCAAITYGTL